MNLFGHFLGGDCRYSLLVAQKVGETHRSTVGWIQENMSSKIDSDLQTTFNLSRWLKHHQFTVFQCVPGRWLKSRASFGMNLYTQQLYDIWLSKTQSFYVEPFHICFLVRFFLSQLVQQTQETNGRERDIRKAWEIIGKTLEVHPENWPKKLTLNGWEEFSTIGQIWMFLDPLQFPKFWSFLSSDWWTVWRMTGTKQTSTPLGPHGWRRSCDIRTDGQSQTSGGFHFLYQIFFPYT